ncbi:hypothetical protein [Runella zeae]|uniref:hypothetical protein n=1 Tax=Runella zeae TaxID=94255 RepID=UPI002353C764|nr:hypothetical protein [Runella zeae]
MKYYLSCILITVINFHSYTQDKESSFFKEQLTEYNQWLTSSHLSNNLKIYTISQQLAEKTLTITIQSNYISLDSLLSVWKGLDNNLSVKNQISIAELLHQQAAFLFDLQPQNLKIKITAKNGEIFSEIYFTDSVEEKHLSTLSGDPIKILLQDLKLPAAYRKIKLSGKSLVKAVTKTLGTELANYYKSKPSSLFYSIHVDTSQTFYNFFTYRITCLKNEIIQENYFEFIEITVDVAQQSITHNAIEIRVSVKGKFCGGIRCPEQRTKFYYSMNEKYDSNLQSYAEIMKKRIEQWLN